MVYQSKDHQSVFVNCSCGCGEGLEIRLNKYSQEEGDICVGLHAKCNCTSRKM